MCGRRLIHLTLAVLLVSLMPSDLLGTAELVLHEDVNNDTNVEVTSVSQCTALLRDGRPQILSTSSGLDITINGTDRTVPLFPEFSNHIPSIGGILLHASVTHRLIDLLKDLINIGASLDVRNKYGITPLYYALDSDFDEGAHILALCGADVNFTTEHGALLHLAVRKRSMKMVRKLVQLGALVDTENNHGYTPLFIAIKLNEIDIAKYLIGNGADINHKTSQGLTLLHNAVLEKDIAACSDLIHFGAKCDTCDDNGYTPLYTSIRQNYSRITDLLLENGADVNFCSPSGNTLLHTAVQEGDIHVVQKLIDLHANVSAEDSWGLTPVHWAVKGGNIEILLILIRLFNSSKKVLSETGDYLIHFAVRTGSVSSTIVLVEFQNLNVQNKKGLTPFALSVYLNRTEIIDLFLNQKELGEMALTYKINFADKWYTPLHLAASEGNLDAAKNLIKYGASVNSKDSDGHSPLWRAIESNNSAMVNLLIDSGGANDSIFDYDSSYAIINLAIEQKCADCVESLLESQIGKNFIMNMKKTYSQHDYRLANSKSATYLESFKRSKAAYYSEILSMPSRDRSIYQADKLMALMRSAIKSGSNAVVVSLLNDGVVSKEMPSFDSLLITALENRQPMILNSIIKQGANISTNVKVFIETPYGKVVKQWSLLHHAAYMNFVKEAKILIDNGLDVNIRDSKLWTPLHVAAMTLNYEMCKLLVENGADLGVKTANGYSPFYIAEYKGATRIMDLLKIPN